MNRERDKMGLWEAVALAVGSMIGASIFSIFGLGAEIAGHNLPLVFLLSGLLAFLVAYSYAHLGARIISNAGPMEFILRGMGDSTLTGALSILTWLTYVVSIALFAKGFTGYFLPLFGLGESPLHTGLVETGLIALFTALNFFGSRAVGRAEFLIVLVKVAVLGVFVVVGIWSVKPEWIRPVLDARQGPKLLDATAIFFLSYMGFGLVTNASENIREPHRNVPRAIYLSIAIVTVIYVLVAVVAVGNLPLDELRRASDFALAEASRPFLGRFGYLLVSIGALFSIASAMNATLYGGANIAYALAREGELPRVFERKVWFSAPEGLYITSLLGLGFALLFNMNGIASITSAVFMVIYLFVIWSHYRLVNQYGGSRPFLLLALVSVMTIFGVLLHYQWQTAPMAFHATWITFAAALAFEVLYRGITRRTLKRRRPAEGAS